MLIIYYFNFCIFLIISINYICSKITTLLLKVHEKQLMLLKFVFVLTVVEKKNCFDRPRGLSRSKV